MRLNLEKIRVIDINFGKKKMDLSIVLNGLFQWNHTEKRSQFLKEFILTLILLFEKDRKITSKESTSGELNGLEL